MSLTPEEKILRREAKPLVDKLASMKENWPSEPSLRHLSPRATDALITYIETDVKVLAPVKWGCLTPFLLLPLLAMMGDTALYVAAAGYFVCWYVCFGSSPQVMPQPAVFALTQTDDLRVLPTLVLATRYSGAQNIYVYNAVFRLLDQVTEEHVGLLNNDAQQHLWSIMMMRHIISDYEDCEIQLRILRALAAVGNQAMLARIVHLAYAHKYNSLERYLMNEARELIAGMRARLERQQVPETLLRAADMPAGASNTLLRSTLAAAPEPAQQLLRASGSEPEGTPM